MDLCLLEDLARETMRERAAEALRLRTAHGSPRAFRPRPARLTWRLAATLAAALSAALAALRPSGHARKSSHV